MRKQHLNAWKKSWKKSSKGLILATSAVFLLTACSEKTPEEYIQEAQAFVAQGDQQAAVVALKNAVQQAPRSSIARFELGKIYLEQKQYESAEKELSRALELGYAANKVIPMLAQALQRTGANVALSEIELEQQDMTSAEKLEVGFRKLQSLYQLEKTNEAQLLIDDLLILDSNTVYKGLVEAFDLVVNTEFEQALTIAKEMYARAPLNRDVLNFTARLYMLNEDPENAAKIYEDYVKVAPDDTEAKFTLANMLVEQRETQRAEQYIDDLLEISETNPLLNQLKGIVRAAAEDYEAAKLYSEKAISGGRPDPTLRLVAGLASYQLGEFEDAVGHLSLVAALLPDNHPGLRILAASQLQTNMGDDAGEVLSRVNEVSSEDATLFSRAGYELIKAGNTNAAREIIEQADKISESADDLTRLGILKLSLNDIEGLVDLESAVDKSPESVTAKATLATAYLGTDQLDKALELAKQWQAEEPNATEGYLLEAEVLQREGKFTEAQSVIDTLQSMDAKNIAGQLASIRLNLRQNNLDQARVDTDRLLAQEPTNIPALASYFALANQAGEQEKGFNRIKQVAQENPSSSNLQLLLGRVALAANKASEAITATDNIEANRQAPAAYWSLRGVALLRNNLADQAFNHYQKWAELYPNQENAVMGQLLVLDGQRKYEEGASLAEEFVGRKENLQITIMQAYFDVMSGNVERARKIYDSIDAQYRDLPFIRGISSRIALAEGNPAQALKDAIVAYDANKNTDNLFVYVRALDLTNQRDKSYQVLSDHLARFENDARARLLFAERQITEDSDAAIASYETILAQFPDNFVVLNNIAYLEMQKGNLEKAADYANRAYEIQPKNAATADTYAQILVQQGKLKEALEAYNRVMNKDMKNEEIFVNYIETLLKNGNTVIAERRMGDLTLTQNEYKQKLEQLRQQYGI